ncbi:MAG: FemAB family PEP-CTERM system-associated protein [Desulfobacterota bacterium]|nr:FemAB family PEP-CTERM system-associated protein [Thermodesulfobacteriota bacterium]
MVKIRLSTPHDHSKWDSFVSQNPEAGHYHWFGWKAAVEKTYGHKGYYLVAEENNLIVGVLPLICMRFPWGKKILVSLPYCDYAGPLGEPPIKKILVEEAFRLKKKLGAQSLEIRFREEQVWLQDDHFDKNRPRQYLKVRMVLDLPESSSDLWAKFKPKLRAQIRRPQKEGLCAEIGKKEFLSDFYQVFRMNMHRLGSPVHSQKWFENLFEEYGDRARIGVVRIKGGFTVAGGVILTIGEKVCVPWASSLKEYNSFAPNMLLYYQFLAWSIENGFSQFDFGRSTPGEGTYKFKEQWGSFPHPLFWFIHPSNGYSSMNFSSNFSIRDKLALLWSKLPSELANFLGPKVRKYISL